MILEVFPAINENFETATGVDPSVETGKNRDSWG
jgi:hypothetical protein